MARDVIEVEVDEESARKWREASLEERSRYEAVIREALAADRRRREAGVRLGLVMDETSRSAQARGLTPEILDQLLADD